MINLKTYSNLNQLKADQLFSSFEKFILQHQSGNFFQSLYYFDLLKGLKGFDPVLILAVDSSGKILGSLLGVFQSNGSNIKSWLSRRMIVIGGPIVREDENFKEEKIAEQLLIGLKNKVNDNAIYIEFRNLFDTNSIQNVFIKSGYTFEPHLNFLVKTDEISAVKKRMSSSKWRQIKSTLKAGVEIVEATSEKEVLAFYEILKDLYLTKVKKPLPSFDFFMKMQNSAHVKIFLTKLDDEVLGGIVCPIFNNKIIYEWYICGVNNGIKNVHSSVLATWAPIEYGIENNYEIFDFMGAGKPNVDYGVREFKARFGGEEVGYGRYGLVVNRLLYKVGKYGLKVYQKIK